ncbi:permease-like cell division protein FtsX [Anaerovorax odorimutans]|uniref:permease-like cell division protein FtsX n=1 Tax=Anaerovorax odorimutans TaxID=109327 RepID=UPI000482FC7A|nr:permease-like cell division protein FtsX [Anaerovorax odorimutans]
MLGSMGYAVKQAFKQVLRNRTMSVASMFSITAMLLILGLFFILLVNINMVTESAKNQFDIVQICLLDDTDYEESEYMITELNDMPEVDNASYLSRDDALEKWKLKWGDNAYLLDSVKDDNPLPNSIVIKVFQLENIDKVVSKAKSFDGIQKINYYGSAVEQIMKITKFIQLGAMIIILFLVVVSVVVVSNTVKLTVLAREREISIMKYVGATNWFIRGPFLVEGMLIGLVSALLSVAIISVIYYKIVELIGQEIIVMLSTAMVPKNFLIFNLVWIFIALGVSIGACGSIISMRRFLDT